MAVAPFVAEATMTTMSSHQGRPDDAEVKPPQRSTTGSPPAYTQHAAPSSSQPRSSKGTRRRLSPSPAVRILGSLTWPPDDLRAPFFGYVTSNGAPLDLCE
jgi:hypothetical protein